MSLREVKDGSKGFVKRVTSSFSSIRSKKNVTRTRTNEPKLLPRSKSTGSSSNYESIKLKKETRIKPELSSKREKIDDRCGGKWRSFDDCDSIWLSSEHCASPTSLIEERRLSVSFLFSVDESVISWLSKIAKESPHQEASCVNKDRCRIPKNNIKENVEKKASKDDSFTTVLESSSQGKRVSFSPSSETISSNVVEIMESKRSSNVVEPLFWPYEQRFDWTPEDILKHFSMSPRRKKFLNAGTSPRSMRAQLLQTRKVDLKEGTKRKLVFNGTRVTNTSKIPEIKRTISKSDSIKKEPIRNCVKRNKSLPSRLRKSNKTCSKVVPLEVVEAEVTAATEKAKAEITTRKLINRRSKTMLEDDFALLNDFSIENAVGLGEFKGREGIDSEFNSDTFFFDDSL